MLLKILKSAREWCLRHPGNYTPRAIFQVVAKDIRGAEDFFFHFRAALKNVEGRVSMRGEYFTLYLVYLLSQAIDAEESPIAKVMREKIQAMKAQERPVRVAWAINPAYCGTLVRLISKDSAEVNWDCSRVSDGQPGSWVAVKEIEYL